MVEIKPRETSYLSKKINNMQDDINLGIEKPTTRTFYSYNHPNFLDELIVLMKELNRDVRL